MTQSEAAQIIQHTLAPAVMISSSALLLLGQQNKFSALFNRFRLLAQEKRALAQKSNLTPFEQSRLDNLKVQLQRLMRRARRVKYGILFSYIAIFLYLSSCALLFADRYFASAGAATCAFGAAMTSSFVAVIFMFAETSLAYGILKLEEKA